MENKKAIYKMRVPNLFYAKAIVPFAVVLGSFLANADYKVIILLGVVSLFPTINNSYFVIEVYEDYFAIILPSVWFNKYLKAEKRFQYNVVKDYDCDIGGIGNINDQNAKVTLELTSGLMNRVGGVVSGKFSQINFTYGAGKEEKRIHRWFSSQQTNELMEANKEIKRRLVSSEVSIS